MNCKITYWSGAFHLQGSGICNRGLSRNNSLFRAVLVRDILCYASQSSSSLLLKRLTQDEEHTACTRYQVLASPRVSPFLPRTRGQDTTRDESRGSGIYSTLSEPTRQGRATVLWQSLHSPRIEVTEDFNGQFHHQSVPVCVKTESVPIHASCPCVACKLHVCPTQATRVPVKAERVLRASRTCAWHCLQ